MLPRLFRGAAALALVPGMAAADYTLHILHINDLHSRLEPISRFDSTCSPEDDAAGECFGGVARLKTLIDARRAELEGENLLVLDAGDQFQGSLFFTTYQGQAAAEFMAMIGFDAMALGNHEFNLGPAKLADFVDALPFPVISGSLDLSQSEELGGKVGRTLVLEVGGERIGLVSAVAADTPELSSPGPDVIFMDEIDSIAAQVEVLEARGVDKIVALTHVGLTHDIRIAEAVEGIDAIVGGHSHTYLSASDPDRAGAYPTYATAPDGTMVPIVQAYAYSKYLGHLTLTFDDAGNVTLAEGDTILVGPDIAKDEAVADRVAALAEPIREKMQEVVAETTAPIDGARESCRARECEMGNLVADAMLDRVRDQGIQIAIQNGGGLRASIDAGEVSMGEVLTVLPFQNTLATFQLEGEDVLAALENGVSQIEEGAGRFPQVAGLKYTFDASAEPGSRVSDVMVMMEGDWQPLDPEATYGVVSNNFMRKGGDGYSMFAADAMNAYDFGPGLEQVVADYLAENSPYTPYTDGRITAK
ncbi:multifunctional 2',3'-cyclic-nucleotide 2'-phosphodiesterase/5'-nucleotidase/3'-nucleotidase [Rhodosalinus halophilus]|uniref:Multifunctional 2',3'-cyclic-nucleotide 2'-phosphodiesterase/5'-nucleotidase/3'-nucleotidase n=1 Tax=Rhodosalinus halophilus TaxID=2259333 RepID=A0A365UE77_9RHOB|nr:5'-nucleotidase C-terminal domain-containing protein [Rhodosalinus halophilus]RBI87587.1 multifunctional 2',3'-cyclic-nucleotide 2'-phosphodiesterase/5'-nucleotidase/3'-nucleotidase [Rhodosalinus halophilus]